VWRRFACAPLNQLVAALVLSMVVHWLQHGLTHAKVVDETSYFAEISNSEMNKMLKKHFAHLWIFSKSVYGN
jgi:hypothetical protein